MNKQYKNFVMTLAKSGSDIGMDLCNRPDACHLWHMVTGVSGEAGELLDGVKKHVLYNKPLDRENVVEELGDIMFYMTGIMAVLEITQEEVLAHNEAKLRKRYENAQYSDKAAQERADKA